MDEKISLLAGRDWWNTVPVGRLNIPTIKVTDGPNGARGDSFFNMSKWHGHSFRTQLTESSRYGSSQRDCHRSYFLRFGYTGGWYLARQRG